MYKKNIKQKKLKIVEEDKKITTEQQARKNQEQVQQVQ